MEDPGADYDLLPMEGLLELDLTVLAGNLPVNDADFADTQLGFHVPQDFNYPSYPLPGLTDPYFNFNTIPELNEIDYTLPFTGHLDTMPTSSEYSPSATLHSSNASTQSFDFSPACSASSLSSNYSPAEQLLPPSLGPTPETTSTHDSSPKKKHQPRRRAKAAPGTRPCDIKRARRKIDKPAQCSFCPQRFQCRRDLEKRHYRNHHPKEAVEMGIDMSRFPCSYCEQDFARKDHLKRHVGRKHKNK